MGSVSDGLVHVLLVSFPGQGHVNPLLRLGMRLASKGLLVTFCTPESCGKLMRKASKMCDHEDDATDSDPVAVGDGFIRFESFQDGWDEEDPRRNDLDQYLPQLEAVGKELLPGIINRHTKQGQPVSCLINNPFIPWVCDVAQNLALPSAMLWVQSCACFSAYYHYYNNSVKFPSQSEPEIDVQLPCMPLLTYEEVPSFLYPTTPYPFLRRAIMEQFRNLDKLFCILMDSFQELERDNIEYMSKICPTIRVVGPLFKAPNNKSRTLIRGDLLMPAHDCIEWLNSKKPSSVVYISFGSVVCLKQEQVDEIAYGLMECTEVCFLWVMKPPPSPPHKDDSVGNHDEVVALSVPEALLEKIGGNSRGKVVEWSPQEQVLGHPSVSCFVTHCGWNSSMEAITSGVPVVAFPQWGDQVTNAKYLVDVFRVGVRMARGEAAQELIKRDEVKRCLMEATVGPKAVEMKENVLKFKAAAEAAVLESGSSNINLQAFVDQLIIRKRRSTTLELLNNNNNTSREHSFSQCFEEDLLEAKPTHNYSNLQVTN